MIIDSINVTFLNATYNLTEKTCSAGGMFGVIELVRALENTNNYKMKELDGLSKQITQWSKTLHHPGGIGVSKNVVRDNLIADIENIYELSKLFNKTNDQVEFIESIESSLTQKDITTLFFMIGAKGYPDFFSKEKVVNTVLIPMIEKITEVDQEIEELEKQHEQETAEIVEPNYDTMSDDEIMATNKLELIQERANQHYQKSLDCNTEYYNVTDIPFSYVTLEIPQTRKLPLETVVTVSKDETIVEQITVNHDDEIIEVTTDYKFQVYKYSRAIGFENYLGEMVHYVELSDVTAKYVNVKTKRVKRSEFVAKNTPKPEPVKVVIPTTDQFIHNQRGYIPPQVFGLMGDKIVYNWLGEILAIDKDGNTIKLMDYSDFAAVLVQEKCKKSFNMAKFLGLKTTATKSTGTARVAANGPRSGYPSADKPSSQKFLQLALEATAKNGLFTLESDIMPATEWAYSNARNYLSYVQSWDGYQLEKLGNRKYRLTQS